MYLIDRFLSAKMGHPVFNADAGAADARTYTHRQPQIGERKRLLFPQRLSNLFRCLFHNSTVYGSKRFVPFSDGKDKQKFLVCQEFFNRIFLYFRREVSAKHLFCSKCPIFDRKPSIYGAKLF